jgi:ABC-type branched-subunit amino acid transport system ATPase component
MLKLDLQRHANRKAKVLSWHDKKMLALAIAILGNPPLLVLDDIFGGLEQDDARAIHKVL